ncbi:MAG: hypothetical protein ABUK01_13970 [Leptospirales bacterium]
MSIKFETTTVVFSGELGVPTPHQGSVTFPTNVTSAECCIKSWLVGYDDATNAWIQQASVQLSNVSINGGQVTFNMTAGMTDEHGYTNKYQANVEVLVIAEVADN